MKNFEKFQEEYCDIITDCGDLRCGECKKIQASVWRAALERVLKERETQGENHLKCVFDWIEQELENGN